MHYNKIITMSAKANYAAVKIYPACHKGSKKRSPKKFATAEAAIKRNKKAMSMKVWSKIVSNFDTGDWFITLTFSQYPNIQDSKENFKRYMRKVKKECQKLDIELKAIWTPPEKGKRKNRIHYHIVINKEVPLKLLRENWTYGIIEASRIDGEKFNNAHYDLAQYMVKDTVENYNRERDLHKKAYSCTKNLLEGITRKTTVKKQAVTVPKGWKLVEGSQEEYLDEFTGFHVIEYRLEAIEPKKNIRWFKGKKIPISEAYTMAKEYIEEQIALF